MPYVSRTGSVQKAVLRWKRKKILTKQKIIASVL